MKAKWNVDGTVTIPSAALIALASAVVHYQEFTDPGAHPVDLDAARAAMQLPGVEAIMADLGRLAMLPVRRDDRGDTDATNT